MRIFPRYLLVLLFTSLASASLASEPRQSENPIKTGVWLKRVGLSISTCQSRDSAWGWEEDGTKVFLLNADGEQVESWTIDAPLRSVYVTTDCEMAWITSADSKRVFAIDKRIREQVIGLAPGAKLENEAWRVCPIEGTHSAWVLADSDLAQNSVVKLEGDGAILRVVPNSNVPAGYVISDHDHALGTTRVWLVPQEKGLNLIDDKSFKVYDGLTDINVSGVYVASNDAFGWAIPTKRGGFYTVDANGSVLNEGRAVLPDENIASIYKSRPKTSDIVWIRTTDDLLYVARLTALGNVELLNKGQPISTEGGGKLEFGTLVSPSGRIAWAMPPSQKTTSGFYKEAWRLVVDPNTGDVSSTTVDPRLYDSKRIRTIFSDSREPDRVWIKTVDRSFYEVKYTDQGYNAPSLSIDGSTSLNVTSLTPSSVPGRYWISTDTDSFLMGSAEEVGVASLNIGGRRLTLDATGTQNLDVYLNDNPRVDVELGWPSISEKSAGTVSARVFTLQQDGSRTLIAEGSGRLIKGKGQLRIVPSGSVLEGGVYQVELSYLDDLGSKLAVTWPTVQFEVPFLSRVLRNKVVVSLFLLLAPTCLLLYFFGKHVALIKWTPVAVPFVDGMAVKFAPNLFNLSLWDFGLITVALFFFTILALLASPRIFQRLAPVQPFNAVAFVALRIPFLRRHVFREYVRGLRRDLQSQRQKANNEDYVGLPIESELMHPPLLLGPDPVPPLTAESLSKVIAHRTSEQRPHLIIHGPGGRGKTALLNELLERALDAFEKNPRCPLPVVGERGLKTVEAMIQNTAGRVVGESIAGRLAEAGDLVVFVDDLESRAIDPLGFENYLFGPGRSSRICSTMRTGSVYLAAINRADCALVVTPCRLDEKNLKVFVEHYQEVDAKSSPRIQKQVLDISKFAEVCKSTDGHYLPLLLRLAMRASIDGRELAGVGDVYEGAIEVLLKCSPSEDDKLWRDVEEIARDTYWDDRTRFIATARITDGKAQLIDALLTAGLLISADKERSLIRRTPRQLRFFHDSVQSYLAARALSRIANWDVLFAAAAEEWFQGARSDIIGEPTSELFAMCLQVFRPVDLLREYLAVQLRNWQDDFHAYLTAHQVVESVPAHLRSVIDEADIKSGSAKCLERAIALCYTEDREQEDANRLGVLYGRLAPLVLPATRRVPGSELSSLE